MKQGIFYLVTVLAFAVLLLGLVSAAAPTSSIEIEVNGQTAGSNAVFAGETVPLKVSFTASADKSDVLINVWLAGAGGKVASTERFDVLSGKKYTKYFSVPIPFNIDPNETLTLEVSVESKDGSYKQEFVFVAQRESYITEILDVNMASTVKAGSTMPVDIVLKNRGYHDSQDQFVKITIPALGVTSRAYFGDLSSVDQPNDYTLNNDAAERRMYVAIPSNAPAGVYDVEVEAYNADSSTVANKKIAVAASTADNAIVSAISTKTFAPGEKVSYTTTLVNSGDKIALYEVVLSSSSGLTVSTDSPVVAVPAGNSNVVKYDVSADKAGTYTFTANIYSSGNLVKTETFTANVQGTGVAGNATVLLTVVLAIIFVVLLVVLIVLLTRKPEKKEEFGESYY
jgi:uncharacterized membrane protein